MDTTRDHKKSFFVLTAVLVASASVFVVGSAACGGGAPDTKTPGTEGASSGAAGGTSSGGASGAAGSGTDPGAGPGSSGGASGGTTTTALPGNNGELQGAKLGSTTHTEVETKGDAGPKAGPGHSQEPGRRVDDLRTIIMARRDEARACYDKGLKDHPGIEGDLTVKFVINPEGAVTDASVDSSKSSINEPGVGQCIVDIIKKIKFAPSKGGFETRANYPYNFHPKTFGKGDAGAK